MLMNKLIATFQGRTFTRTTHRSYSHLVVGRIDKANDVACARWWAKSDPAHMNKCLQQIEEREAAGYYEEFHAVCWCGRPDLAQKAAHGRRGWSDLHIVPVTVA